MLSFKQFKMTKSDAMMPMIENFVGYCCEYLQLDEEPDIQIIRDGSIGHAFGCYSEGTIKLNIMNRHPMDVLRTLAHEVVHFQQDVNGELHELSGETGSDHENEANSMAGILMRNFGRANPEYFSHGAILEGYINELKVDDDNGFGGGEEWIQPTVLRHEETGKLIKKGDVVTRTRTGEKQVVHGIYPPKHSNSTGHISFQEFGTTYFVPGYGLKFYHV